MGTPSGDALGRRRAPLVVTVDGTRVTEVRFRSGEAVSVSEHDHGTELEAVQAAASKRGNRLLVWCGPVSARVSRPAASSEHPDAAALADAAYLQKVFGKDRPAAMSGEVAMSPDMADDTAAFVASRRPRMVMSGMCVRSEDEGIWLRVGRSVVEATLVHGGRISGWSQLCEGLDSVAGQISGGRAAQRARSDLAERVVLETRRAIMQWQRTRTVPPSIWLHGPGGDPSGDIHQALLSRSGCRVALPAVDAAAEAAQHALVLPVAACSLAAARLQQPARVLQSASRGNRALALKVAASAVAVLAVMAIVAALQGRSVGQRIDAATREIGLYQDDPQAAADKQIVAEAEEAQTLLSRLSGSGGPNWEMLFALNERFRGYAEDEEFSLRSDRQQTSISLTVPGGIEHLTGVLDELDVWAEAIYGPGAYSVSGSGVDEIPGSGIQVTVLLGHHREQ
ncbi:MAG: hypothetical protein OXP08_08525 [bacterium]|nr:hypothetical protein [bacterium]